MYLVTVFTYRLVIQNNGFYQELKYISTNSSMFFLSIFSPSFIPIYACSNNSGEPGNNYFNLLLPKLYEGTWQVHVQFHALYISTQKYLFPLNFKMSSYIDFYEQNRNVIHWMSNLLIFYSIAGKLQNRTSTVNHCWCHCYSLRKLQTLLISVI